MTNEQINTLVFKDQAGGYYLLPREALEQGRVPAERTAEVERLIAEQPDVQGHFAVLPFLVACASIAVAAEVIIGYSGPQVRPVDSGGLLPVEREWRGSKF